MQLRRYSFFFVLVTLCGLSSVPAQTAPPPTALALTATNVTLSADGAGSSQFTVTGLGAGTAVIIGCNYTGTQAGAVIPACPAHSSMYTVPSGGTLTGTIQFSPPSSTAMVAQRGLPVGQNNKSGNAPAAGLALAGALLLGFGLRRRRWLAHMVFAAGFLVSLVGISACSGGLNGMTPGTYQYTITAPWSGCDFLCNAVLPPPTPATISVTVP